MIEMEVEVSKESVSIGDMCESHKGHLGIKFLLLTMEGRNFDYQNFNYGGWSRILGG